ncbi:MAG: hypothetical protein JOZ52_13310, partial [Acidobacteria bacterium]|nr:hypothetical protein [Acidobacteriota bacterium]
MGFPVETIERVEEWRRRYADWEQKGKASGEDLDGYPFVENRRAPFTPARAALSMLNLALISSAGGYIDGTDAFDTKAAGGDTSYREIPIEVEAEDILFAPRGYDPQAVRQDMNAQAPVARLLEFESNGIIARLNPVWWSFNGFIPDAARLA